MKAMLLKKIGLIDGKEDPLEFAEVPKPEPKAGEIRVRVAACGVCHTEL